jgi:hypothetical protein
MNECLECRYNGGMGGCTLKKCKRELFTSAAREILTFCASNEVPACVDVNFRLYCIGVYVCGGSGEDMRFNTTTLFADYNIEEILKIKEELAAWTKA